MLLFGIPLLVLIVVALLIIDAFLFYFEVEKWGGRFFLILLGALGLLAYSSIDTLSEMAVSHGGWLTLIVKLIGAWIVAGAATGFLKWLQLSNKVKRFIKEHRETYGSLSAKDFFTAKLDRIAGWDRVSKGAMRFVADDNGMVDFKLNSKSFRDLLIDWMTYWPVHLAVLLFADLVRIIFDFIIDASQSMLRRVTLIVWGNVLK